MTRSQTAADDLLARIHDSPDVYPQKIELARDAALLVKLDADAYRAASFLDDRILGPATQGAWTRIGRLQEAARGIASPNPVHFIFHTGHVGSTLVSRLLDQSGIVLSLREPLPLRTLAEMLDVLEPAASAASKAQFESLLQTLMQLWGRGYSADRSTVVKATSTAGRAAAAILERNAASRAIYLNLSAEPYLTTLLAGQNSPVDLRGHGPGRLQRLERRIGRSLAPLASLSLGELAALGWLAETCSQVDAAQSLGDRLLSIDFDRFLAASGAHMAQIAAHLGLPVTADFGLHVERSAVLTRYSKAPQYEYSPALRAEILADSRHRHATEIRRGLQWLEALAKSDPSIAAVVRTAGL